MRFSWQKSPLGGAVPGIVFCVALLVTASAGQTRPADSQNSQSGDAACARCHAAIYESYERTSMAHASGPAMDALASADFTHKESGVHYRIYTDAGRAWLSFDRPGDRNVNGRRELLYFIGSGRRGRTYLFQTDGFLFESPVNWYANKQMWDTAPAYQASREIPLNLPAYSSCLHCHVSGMQPPRKGTENLYPDPPFTQNGVSCERCHGPGAAHLNGGPIVNPAKLSPVRRDQVCMQCHLEGKVAIERSGHHVYEYKPGEDLSEYIRYFVSVGAQGSSLAAVSQEEALAQSQCKKKTGDAMSCTSCHDPHRSPAPEERVAYFRGKCLTCHGTGFAAKHHPDRPDCVACHMPSDSSADVAHTQVTDHRILRRPQIQPSLLEDQGTNPGATASAPKLIEFSPANNPSATQRNTDARDLALAWASLAEGGMAEAEGEAYERLTKAIQQFPNDPTLLTLLGYAEQKRGDPERARVLYRRALAIEPTLVDAQTNLGVIEAHDGHFGDAIQLWTSAFENAPDRSGIGLNLARAYCAEGKITEARSYTKRVMEFNPDFAGARKMLRGLSQSPPNCAP